MEKDPMNYSILTYLWVLIMATWGGVAHNFKKIKEGDLKSFSIAELIGDMVIAGFIGVITFFLCEYAKFAPTLTAVMVGIASHQGTRGMVLLEKVVSSRLKIEMSTKDEDKK